MSGKRYYGYQGKSGHRRGAEPRDGLFGWTVFIFLLIGFVFLCWMGSYYIFANPEKAANYRLLLRMHKIEPPVRFEITGAPRGEFLKPGQLLERFGSMTTSEIRRFNSNLLRRFIRNYHQDRELVPYAVGTYRVLGTSPLTKETFCRPGLVALLQAVEQPEVLLEQPFTAQDKDLPGLKRSLVTGQQIKLEKPLDLSAVIHIERLSENKILLTTMPLLYGTYGAAKGETSFSLEPPEELNLEAGLPILSTADITRLSGGKITGNKDKEGNEQENPSGHLRRIAEEMATPTPEPKVAKALPVNQPPALREAAPASPAEASPQVARAIPVNEPAVLPAIPVSTPIGNENTPAIPRAIPVGTPLPTPTPIATPISTPTPLPTPPTPPTAKATPTPAPKPNSSPTAPLQTNAATLTATNQPVAARPSEIWPVYEPGKMPRGRLVESSEAQGMASKGIGGERHYLQGRFAVTASGNGRAVFRPQGAIAGVPLGPNARVRVIVDFPSGTTPPAEGNVISRDNLRPFQITSVKRGDDGQINIYAREITRGQ
jgi:hypothetical protein